MHRFSSATEVLAALDRGETTSAELVDAMLERIDRDADEVGAFVTVDHDGARAAAREADDVRAGGRATGPLHGLPITLKDAFATAGLRTTAGMRDLADHVPDADAVVVQRLRPPAPSWWARPTSRPACPARRRPTPWPDGRATRGMSTAPRAAPRAGPPPPWPPG
jgi:hypothetical protein